MKKLLIFLFVSVFLTGCGNHGSNAQDWMHNFVVESVPIELEQSDNTQELVDEETSKQNIIIAEDVPLAECMVFVNGEQYNVEEGNILQYDEEIYCSLKVINEYCGAGREYVPVSYLDENGLICKGFSLKYKENENAIYLRKYYCLLDNTIVYFDEKTDIPIVKKNETIYVTLQTVRDLAGEEFCIDYDDKCLSVVYETVDETEDYYEPIVMNVISGHVWRTDGTLALSEELMGEEYKEKFSCTSPETPIPVQGGETLVFTFYLSWFQDVATILFLDDAGDVITAYNSNASVYYEQKEIIVPDKATKMHLSFFNNQRYSVMRKKVGPSVSELRADVQFYELERYEKMIKNVTDSISVESYSLDKPYITFVLDDCRSDMDIIADIFAEYQIPLCVAAVWEHMYFPGAMGESTRAEVCHEIVENGGEILAHDAEVLTFENLTNSSVMEKHFVLDKFYFEQLGFDVNGIILAGGSGQIEGSVISDLWSRNYYLYSDLYGQEEKGEPYFHRRYWLGNHLDNYKEVMSDAINKQQWLCFYFHDLREVNEEQLRDILEYTKSRSDEITVTNYKDLYDKIVGER